MHTKEGDVLRDIRECFGAMGHHHTERVRERRESTTRHRTRILRVLHLAILGVMMWGASGCQAYRRTSVPAVGGPERSLGERVRITTDSGVVYELANAKVQGDSVVGAAQSSGERTAIAVSHIRKVEEWSTSGWRTTGLIGGVVVVMAAVVLVGLILILVKAAGG